MRAPTAKPSKDPTQVAQIIWVAGNRGALTAIAKQCNCTPQFVHMVLIGQRQSKGGVVEGKLRRLGAPVKAYKKRKAGKL